MPQDISGRSFGRWIVVGPVSGRARYFHCRCSYGVEKAVFAGSLLSGRGSSCGCIRREQLAERNKSHGSAGTVEYRAWLEMKRRCFDATRASFKNYGARGVCVDPAWKEDFASFLAAVGNRPSSKHTLDRIDNNGDYAPGNVRWATRDEQARNKRNNRRLTANSETLTLSEWARRLGVCHTAIIRRLKCGWDTTQAVTLPSFK